MKLTSRLERKLDADNDIGNVNDISFDENTFDEDSLFELEVHDEEPAPKSRGRSTRGVIPPRCNPKSLSNINPKSIATTVKRESEAKNLELCPSKKKIDDRYSTLLSESSSFDESISSDRSDDYSIKEEVVLTKKIESSREQKQQKCSSISSKSIVEKYIGSSKIIDDCSARTAAFREKSLHTEGPESDAESPTKLYERKIPVLSRGCKVAVGSKPYANSTVRASTLLATVKTTSKRSLSCDQDIDVESGKIAHRESKWVKSNNDNISRDAFVNASTSKRSRRRFRVSVALVVLVAAVICGLVGTNVIPRPWESKSASKLATGENPINLTNDGNYSTPSQIPSQLNAILVVPGKVFYADWDLFKCVQDCEGPEPCGGFRESWEQPFDTLHECCEKYFPEKNVDKCGLVVSDERQKSLSPTGSVLKIPTRSPTLSTDYPSYNPSDAVTYYPAIPNEGTIPSTEIPTIIPSAMPPVTAQISVSPSNAPIITPITVSNTAPTPTPTNNPTTQTSTTPYEPTKHPTSAPQRTTELPTSVNVFTIDPTVSPSAIQITDAPTLQPTEHIADNECYIYYPDRNIGLCVPDYCSSEREPWETTYADEEECCLHNFYWDRNSDCYFEPSTSAPTANPTGLELNNQFPTGNPVEIHAQHSVICPDTMKSFVQIDWSTRFHYSIVHSESLMSRRGVLCGQLEYDGVGWVALAISRDKRMVGSEAIIGLPVDILSCVNVMDNSKQTLLHESIVVDDGRTIMKFAKFLEEEGEIPILQDGLNYFLHARGSSTTLGYHSDRLSFELDFRNEPYISSTTMPTMIPTSISSAKNSGFNPTHFPTLVVTIIETNTTTTKYASESPIQSSTIRPSKMPSAGPTAKPTTMMPTRKPSAGPTSHPTTSPSDKPTNKPSKKPTAKPTSDPTKSPSKKPTRLPTFKPTLRPTKVPTTLPTSNPTPRGEELKQVLTQYSPNSEENLSIQNSPQFYAMDWLLDDPNLASYDDDKKLQRWVLATLFYGLVGREWYTRKGWLDFDGDLMNECSWHGIECNSMGFIVSIDLSGNGLMGNIPYEITHLHSCVYLGLSGNYLVGMDSSVFNMESLKVLDLEDNSIRELPSEFHSRSILEELYVSHNKLKRLPKQIFQFQNLEILWLYDNELSSTLPSEIGNLKSLVELDLEANFFTGYIPTELFQLTSLETLYMYDNILSGEVSPLFSQLEKISIVDLDTNYFSGTIPSDIGNCRNLTELYLHDNEITGQLPETLSDLSKLKVFDVSLNYLNSTIIEGMGMLTNLEILRLDNNYRLDGGGNVESIGIYGSIPDLIGNLRHLRELRMDNNFVGGSLPTTLGNLKSLVTLRLESNDLRGIIPMTLSNAVNLQYLHLWSNYLSGTLHSNIGKLTQINEFFLDDNELTGTIPPQIGKLLSATYISLANNYFEGTIPSELGNLQNLEKLELHYNNLYGELPLTLVNIPLVRLQLEGNYLYGDIPVGVCESASVEYISANCAATKRPTPSPTSKPIGSNGTNPVLYSPTASPTYEYWWSCNCCTYCIPFH
ncbi:hypothetical protein ACHAXS_011765 [Conticribra weissflogii]